MEAVRLWSQFGSKVASWSGGVGVSDIASSNRNYLADTFENRTSGARRTADAQVEHRFGAGSVTNRVIAAADLERESFHARDEIYGGATDQDRTRNRHSL